MYHATIKLRAAFTLSAFLSALNLVSSEPPLFEAYKADDTLSLGGYGGEQLGQSLHEGGGLSEQLGQSLHGGGGFGEQLGQGLHTGVGGYGNTAAYRDASSYAVSEQGEHGGGGAGGSGGSLGGGDYHQGVSIVGASGGRGGHGVTFDLTKHGAGGQEHTGPFGGSFVASAKYEGGAAGHTHKLGGDSVSYVNFDHGHYSDVLGADHGGGGDHEASSGGLGQYH